MKRLDNLNDEELKKHIGIVEQSLFFTTTEEEKIFILPFVRKFLEKIENFKQVSKYLKFEPLINLSKNIPFADLEKYMTLKCKLYHQNSDAIIRNFPKTDKTNLFLIYTDECKE